MYGLVYGGTVCSGVIPGDGALVGLVGLVGSVGPVGGVLTYEPGYPERVCWLPAGGIPRRPDAPAIAAPCVVVANNLNSLVRTHRARVDAGEPAPPHQVGLDDLPADGLLAGLANPVEPDSPESWPASAPPFMPFGVDVGVVFGVGGAGWVCVRVYCLWWDKLRQAVGRCSHVPAVVVYGAVVS
ncbi:MAG TPA: hypothetical protein VLJ59_00770 [Mycobacteriales bacterium]|nr:hypothetical protein [Mycobacteriales bacterium]